MKIGSESIEAIMLSSRIMFVEFVARTEYTRLPKYVMFGELMESTGCVGAQEKTWKGCLLDDLRAFGTNAEK